MAFLGGPPTALLGVPMKEGEEVRHARHRQLNFRRAPSSAYDIVSLFPWNQLKKELTGCFFMLLVQWLGVL